MGRESRLVLASRSPQRRAILERVGVPFTVRPGVVEELTEGRPAQVALLNALRKARTVAGGAPGGDEEDGGGGGDVSELVLGVDTLVALEGAIYGKPGDEAQARRTLGALGGKVHTVYSGVALVGGGQERTAVAATEVVFRELDHGLIDWYVATGEWRERAGGYAIQGAGAALVRAVRGDYENVVGLPLATLLDLCPELLAPA